MNAHDGLSIFLGQKGGKHRFFQGSFVAGDQQAPENHQITGLKVLGLPTESFTVDITMLDGTVVSNVKIAGTDFYYGQIASIAYVTHAAGATLVVTYTHKNP